MISGRGDPSMRGESSGKGARGWKGRITPGASCNRKPWSGQGFERRQGLRGRKERMNGEVKDSKR